MQAADSLSFLEVNRALLVRWVSGGESTAAGAKDQARWMFERIRVPAARRLAEPLYDETVSAVERVARAGRS